MDLSPDQVTDLVIKAFRRGVEHGRASVNHGPILQEAVTTTSEYSHDRDAPEGDMI